MVLVEEVPEEVLLRENEHDSEFETDSVAASDDLLSDDEDEDFSLEDETFYDRVVALKDIVPPQTRSAIAANVEGAKGWVSWGFQKTGAIAWIVSTSALLVGLPLALAIEDETRITQQEREMQAQSAGQQQVSSWADIDRSRRSADIVQLLGGGQQPQGVMPPGFW
jgi:import receptor subunit TOM22